MPTEHYRKLSLPNKPYQKLITTPKGRIITRAFLNKDGPLTCSHCKQLILTNDYMQGCCYCNCIFCETCITNGPFERHRNNCEAANIEE